MGTRLRLSSTSSPSQLTPVNHYLLLLSITQCLLVGIEIIHENPASPTHSESRKVFDASVGGDRLMTHCSCLHLESKKKKKGKNSQQAKAIK